VRPCGSCSRSWRRPVLTGVASAASADRVVISPGHVLALTRSGSGCRLPVGPVRRPVAAFVRGGHCYVFAPSGSALPTYAFRPGSVQEFALGGRGLVVQLPGGRIEVHGGRRVRVFSIPPRARMLDYAENTLLYRIGNTLRGRFLWSGKDGVLRDAQLGALESSGLSYAEGYRVGSLAWGDGGRADQPARVGRARAGRPVSPRDCPRDAGPGRRRRRRARPQAARAREWIRPWGRCRRPTPARRRAA
jgi:hypothetical protein